MTQTLPEDDLQILKNYAIKLKGLVRPNPKRKTIPHRIKLKETGEYITTSSRKTIWPSIGAAKAALRNDFPALFRYDFHNYKHMFSGKVSPYHDYKERSEREEAAYQEFITNWVEFVPCPN